MKLKRVLGVPLAVQNLACVISLALCAVTLAHLAAAWERENAPAPADASEIFDLALLRLAPHGKTPEIPPARKPPVLLCADGCRVVFPGPENGETSAATLDDLNRELAVYPARAFVAAVETPGAELKDPQKQKYEGSFRIFAGSRRLPAPGETGAGITVAQALEQYCDCPGNCRAEVVHIWTAPKMQGLFDKFNKWNASIYPSYF